jgi:hypothetical protein
MNKKLNLWTLCLLFAAVVLGIGSFTAFAATPNPSPSSVGYQTVVIPVLGTYSSTSITPVSFKIPFRYRVLSASATARAVTGTNPTLTVDVKSAGTSVFSSPVAVTAGSIADAVLSASPLLTDEGTISVILAAGGTAPKWKDVTILLALKRM